MYVWKVFGLGAKCRSYLPIDNHIALDSHKVGGPGGGASNSFCRHSCIQDVIQTACTSLLISESADETILSSIRSIAWLVPR